MRSPAGTDRDRRLAQRVRCPNSSVQTARQAIHRRRIPARSQEFYVKSCRTVGSEGNFTGHNGRTRGRNGHWNRRRGRCCRIWTGNGKIRVHQRERVLSHIDPFFCFSLLPAPYSVSSLTFRWLPVLGISGPVSGHPIHILCEKTTACRSRMSVIPPEPKVDASSTPDL